MFKIVAHYYEDTIAIQDISKRSVYFWSNQVIYTRNYMISLMNNLPDQELVYARLITNQDSIGNILSPYYTQDVIDQFVGLLKEYVAIVKELIQAAMSNNDMTTIQARLVINGDAIISCLDEVNPMYWSKSEGLTGMWTRHLGYLTDQITARVASDWAKDLDALDSDHDVVCGIDNIADLFAMGIVYHQLEFFSKK